MLYNVNKTNTTIFHVLTIFHFFKLSIFLSRIFYMSLGNIPYMHGDELVTARVVGSRPALPGQTADPAIVGKVCRWAGVGVHSLNWI